MPTPEHIRDEVCAFCPSRVFGPGQFDVAERPDKRWPWDPETGRRVDVETGAGVCVHPHKVRLAPGRYASDGTMPDTSAWDRPTVDEPAIEAEPAPAVVDEAAAANAAAVRRFTRSPRRRALAPVQTPAEPAPAASTLAGAVPTDPAGLGGWLAQLLGQATPDAWADILDQAEAAARTRHPDAVVLAAMREALAGG